PLSCQRPPGRLSTTPVATLETAASVNSAPLWQRVQLPLPVNALIPCCSREERALWLPSMNWSKRELSDTSVLSYIWMATPQNMEKLYSMSEYSFVFCAVPSCR